MKLGELDSSDESEDSDGMPKYNLKHDHQLREWDRQIDIRIGQLTEHNERCDMTEEDNLQRGLMGLPLLEVQKKKFYYFEDEIWNDL